MKCKKVPDEVKQKCFKNLDEIAKKKKGKQEHEKEVRENVQIAIGEDEVIEVESLAGSSSTPRKLGPMDKFVPLWTIKACQHVNYESVIVVSCHVLMCVYFLVIFCLVLLACCPHR